MRQLSGGFVRPRRWDKRPPVGRAARREMAIATLVYRLANEPGLTTNRVPASETEALFRKFNLEKRMKGVGLWPFADESEDAKPAEKR